MRANEYDDNIALRAYIAKHCRHFMTPLERRVTEYSFPLTSTLPNTETYEKFRKVYHYVEDRDGHVDDSDVEAAFEIPLETREKNAIDRLVLECLDQLPINRCPECSRIVRTPTAQQCLWCGYDWHNRE